MLQTNVIPFLTELTANNNKAWFEKNKSWFKQAQQDFYQFIDEVIPLLTVIDTGLNGISAKDCVFRIYRDVRFSKDKTPYKNHFGAYISGGGRKGKKAGFYIHIQPVGTSFIGGGLYGPEAAELKAVRNEIYQVPEELLEIINHPDFKKYYGGLWQENKLKTAPKGFPKDFKYMELLQLKSFVATHNLSAEQLTSEKLPKYVAQVLEQLYPLNRLMNTILEDAGLA